MNGLVLDASAAFLLLRGGPGGTDVRVELRRAVADGDAILVPPLFWLEVVNVLARRYAYPPDAIVEAVYELEQTGVTTADAGRPTTLAIIDAVARWDLTAYDAAYLVLAEASDARLLTGDSELANAAGRRALLVGARGGIGEEPRRYRAPASWPGWRGAARYLRELRESVRLAD